jgi:hypothetical protein
MAKTYSREELYRIAVAQKAICIVILVQILSFVLQMVLPQGIAWAGLAIYLLASLVGLFFIVIFLVRVYGGVLGILMAVLSIIPLVGLLILLAANARATKALQGAGLKVGLLGADLKAVKETPLEELTNVFE